MDAAKIHDIKDNRRSSLGRNSDRDGNWISASEESQERLQDQRASRKDNARLGKERKDAPILESGAESQVIVCCREPEGCGFVCEDDFIFGEELMSTAWMEVDTNNEKMILMKNTDGDDRTVTVLSRLAMWKSEIRVDSRQILVAKMNLDGASTMSAANTAAKAQEKLDKETPMFRRATMGVSAIVQMCNERWTRCHEPC